MFSRNFLPRYRNQNENETRSLSFHHETVLRPALDLLLLLQQRPALRPLPLRYLTRPRAAAAHRACRQVTVGLPLRWQLEITAATYRCWSIATSAQVRVRSNQVVNSPLNQCYVTCMLVSRPTEDTTRYQGSGNSVAGSLACMQVDIHCT